MRRATSASLFLTLSLVAGTAGAASPDTGEARRQIDQAERTRATRLEEQQEAERRAEATEAEAKRLAAERVAAAARLREAELARMDAASRIQTLLKKREHAEAQLQAHAEALAPLLPVIERLSLYPAETLLAIDAAPDDALRGVLVLQGIGRRLEEQAREFRAEEAALDAARQAIAAEAPKLAAAEAAQAAQSAALDAQIAAAEARSRGASDEASAFAREAAVQATRARSLRDVMRAIEAARAARQQRTEAAASARQRETALARPVQGSLSSAEGRLTAPVAGILARGFGEATDAGPATGISYRPVPGARVVAPCGGRAVFASPFRSFGLLLIIDCGGGYHAVLAGLDRLDVHAGAALQQGEPVGVMPAGGGALYVELRHAGQPIDPAPLLRGRG